MPLRNIIDYIDLTSISGNALDRGTLSIARRGPGAVSNSLRSFWCGGNSGVNDDTIDYIDNTVLTGNALDSGNLSAVTSSGSCVGCDGDSKGYLAGIATLIDIDVLDITVIGVNAFDWGELSISRDDPGGCNA